MENFAPDTSRMILLIAEKMVGGTKPLLDWQVRDLRQLYQQTEWSNELARYVRAHPDGEHPPKISRGRPSKHVGLSEQTRRARILADYWILMIFDEGGERSARDNVLSARRDRVIERLQRSHHDLPSKDSVRNNLTLWTKDDMTRRRAVFLFRDWLYMGKQTLKHWR